MGEHTLTLGPPDPVDALAADGSYVRIRPAGPGDTDALVELHDQASARSRYLRFFTNDANAGRRFVTHLMAPPAAGEQPPVVLLAERSGAVVAMGAYLPSSAVEAEVAFLVADSCHGLGLGTLLLEQLAAVARERGIRRFRAEVLLENRAMVGVLVDSGFAERSEPDGPTTSILLDTALDDRALRRILDRERMAENRSLDRLLAPRSVAVVGAGRLEGPGHRVVRNLLAAGFTGSVHPVNPTARAVRGVPAVAKIGDISPPVDLAVIAVPAPAVLDVVAECGQAGVAAVLVISAGFAEAGPEGRQAEAELLSVVRRYGMRLVGPNCLGVVNTGPDVRLNASFGLEMPPPGGLCLASQSGAVGIAVLDAASRNGLGVAEFVSLGNKADVSGNDLLLEWWRDPRADVIGLYLESFGNPRRFARIARLVASDKPVLVVKGGRSSRGSRAGASHTAAAATPDRVLDALCASAGVVRLDSLPELLDVARLLAGRPLPQGSRLAVLGNAGGGGVLAADVAAAAGLEVPPLTTPTIEALRALGPVDTDGNPLDLGATASAAALAEALRIVAGSGEVDLVVAVVASTGDNDAPGALDAIARAAAECPEVPVTVVALGAVTGPQRIETDGVRIPIFEFPETAVRALGHVARYAAWRRRPQGEVPQLTGVDLAAARTLLDEFLGANREGGWLPPVEAATFLRAIGIDVAPGVVVTDPDAAEAAATQLEYPVVLKSAVPDLVHKTDRGAVRTDLRAPWEVRAAYAAVVRAAEDPRVLVQPLVTGTELLIGLARDPDFGPVVAAGSGGVLTDLVGDRVYRGLPLTDVDATEMIAGPRIARLLAGYRGAPPVAIPAVTDVLHRVAVLAERFPEIAELDLNPVMTGPDGATVVDARIRVIPAGPEPDPYRRRLSPAR